MWLFIGMLISGLIAVVGCFVGFTYHIIEWIFDRELKWMYPIAETFWVIGFYPLIVLIIISALK